MLFFMAATLIFSAAGCNNGADNAVDASKTQIRVFAYNGGYGLEWLYDAIENFEEKYASFSFETGKTGVQVHVEPGSNGGTSIINTGRYDIIFSEGNSNISDDISNGYLRDITDIVTEPLTEFGETGNIEDKFISENQKSYFHVDFSGSGNKRYYTLPLYSAFYGIIYDVDLFEDYGFFIQQDGSFGAYDTGTLSAGPDGKSGTSDDGLPATYDEFFDLCDYIAGVGLQPLVLNGTYRDWYIENFLSNLHADNEGYDQMLLNYSFNGKATTLVESITDGKVHYMPETDIDNEKGALVYKQAGRYYATQFLSRILEGATNGYFDTDKTYSPSYSHTQAQEDFLYSNVVSTETPIAMLIEGNYWEEEAEKMSVYDDLSARYQNVGRNDRRFGFMPYPKATAEQVYDGNRMTFQDSLFAQLMVPSTVSENIMPAVKKFIQLFYTDAQMVNFTMETGTTLAMDYTVPQENRAQLSYYTNSFLDYYESDRADYIYPASDNIMYLDNVSAFYSNAWTSFAGNSTRLHPLSTLRAGFSAQEIFEGYYAYRSSGWQESYDRYF